ncbi:MAG: hypothetical protein ABI880_03370 [Acidobacteriota bacterium]
MKQWVVALGVLVVLGAGAALGVVARVTRQAEPRMREEVQRWLSARLNSDVQLESLTVTLRPALRVEGTNLVLRIKDRPDLPPFISIKRISGTGGFTTLRAKRLSEVRLEGVEIVVPPGRKADLKPLREATHAVAAVPVDPGTVPAPPFIIERLVASSARLIVMPRDADHDSQEWDIRDLKMEPFSLDAAAPFSATVDTPLPADRAAVSGTVGPWPSGEFGRLPIAASYTFVGDVGAVPGLDGRLDASGAILGTLERLATNGVVTSKAIGLRGKDAGRLPMTTDFEAVLDGTNGDLYLTRVATTLGESAFQTSGQVLREKGKPGRHVALKVATLARAELADVLRLLIDGAHPPMNGRLTLKGTLDLPPGQTDVLQRLAIDGAFELTRTRFANPEVQAKIDDLSRKGQGKPDDDTIAKVPSELRGQVRLRRQQLSLSSVVFTAPGATIEASGEYGLASEEMQFRGVAKLDATLSRTMRGARRVLLRPLDPLFRKDGAGTRLVVDVTGTRNAPVVDLDVGASIKGRK